LIFIYSSSENNTRLEYIARHIFNHILGIDFEIVGEKALFLRQKGICVNYSEEPLNHGLQIVPQGLLTEKGVREIMDLAESEWKSFFCFFSQAKGDIPFDLFSAAFYLLTSYEEYFSKKLDEHGRFDEKAALSYRKDFLEIPLIDRWAYCLKEELEKIYLETDYKLRKYRYVSTFDIDFPYIYRYKGLFKNTGAMIRDLLKFDFSKILERLSVVFRFAEDPYMQAIKWLNDFHKKSGIPYYIFVLLGKRGKYGKSTVYPTRTYYRYLQNLNRKEVSVGLHPSYDTYHNSGLLNKEKKALEKILDDGELAVIRRHFLRMTCPESFREAISAGFSEDFTFGFSKCPGFRSGTAIPYYFYDVENDVASNLLVRPTIVMDATLINHLHLSPEEALLKINRLADECKKSGGDFLSLWHNSNLAGDEERNPWVKIFIESFYYAISLKSNNFAENFYDG
jgi:hypothetical protein